MFYVGAGYVGSHTIIELLNTGKYNVIAIDNLCNAYMGQGLNLPESLKRVQEITGKEIIFYNADIRDRKSIENIFKKVRFYFKVFKKNLLMWHLILSLNIIRGLNK